MVMALPKINDTPKYEVIVPSTKKKVKYRPFLVKEQKVLLLALETNDDKSILNAIVDTIDSCILDDIDVNKLTSFDVEYLFTQIRSASVGERAKLGFTCVQCEQVNEISVDVSKINIDLPKEKTDIKITDEYTLVMKYPSYKFILNESVNHESTTESLYQNVIMYLDKLKSEDEQLNFADEPKDEVLAFIDNLTPDQFDPIMKFINSMPKLRHEVNFKCEQCEHNNIAVMEGMNDFF
jgi:hypothetical protein